MSLGGRPTGTSAGAAAGTSTSGTATTSTGASGIASTACATGSTGCCGATASASMPAATPAKRARHSTFWARWFAVPIPYLPVQRASPLQGPPGGSRAGTLSGREAYRSGALGVWLGQSRRGYPQDLVATLTKLHGLRFCLCQTRIAHADLGRSAGCDRPNHMLAESLLCHGRPYVPFRRSARGIPRMKCARMSTSRQRRFERALPSLTFGQ